MSLDNNFDYFVMFPASKNRNKHSFDIIRITVFLLVLSLMAIKSNKNKVWMGKWKV